MNLNMNNVKLKFQCTFVYCKKERSKKTGEHDNNGAMAVKATSLKSVVNHRKSLSVNDKLSKCPIGVESSVILGRFVILFTCFDSICDATKQIWCYINHIIHHKQWVNIPMRFIDGSIDGWITFPVFHDALLSYSLQQISINYRLKTVYVRF